MLTSFRHALSWFRRRPPTMLYHPPFPTGGRIAPFLPHLIDAVRPFTMTSPERIAALAHALEYLTDRHIPGAVVECGVWRGGSMMAAAWALLHLGATPRDLFLFDTFAGMTQPGPRDVDLEGRPALQLLQEQGPNGDHVRAAAALERVRLNLALTRFPSQRLHFIPGDVADTIPPSAPESIALLRLDTDWYASTYHELTHLYPRLAPGGILIVDDYGHWQGARQAVDQFLNEQGIRAPLHPIDYTGRLLIKEEA